MKNVEDRIASTEGRVSSTESDNEVQDQRLADLEQGTTSAFSDIDRTVTELREELTALKQERETLAARLQIVEGSNGDIDRTVAELREELTAIKQERETLAARLQIVEGSSGVHVDQIRRQGEEVQAAVARSEKTQADLAQALRRQRARDEADQQAQTEQRAELDALFDHLSAIQAALQSPIANLPSLTAADKLFRQAHAHVLYGDLDLAADRFGEFRETYPDDTRAVEALFRQAQVYFLARKYDHALVPSVALMKEYPEHVRIADARWILARSLEETGDFTLARRFYEQMIQSDSPHKTDAMRRIQFLNQLQPQFEDGDR